jgi:putative thioredoxin
MTTEAFTDVVDATFEADVLTQSHETPVVVDFWAPWCDPCRVIGPILEQLAGEYEGRVRLVKVNVDENPAVATQYQISSIPAVVAFSGGAPVNQFIGAVPEPQARDFFESLVPNEADTIAREGVEAANRNDTEAATTKFEAALDLDERHLTATLGLAQIALEAGDNERATELALKWESDPEGARIVALARLRSSGDAEGDRDALLARLAADEGDAAAHYALANIHAAASEWDGALEHLIATVRLDRTIDDDGARRKILDLFNVLGNGHPLTDDYRQQLSSLLF